MPDHDPLPGTRDTNASPDAIAHLVDALRARQGELVDEGVRSIRGAIPSYAAIADPAFIADVRAHVQAHHVALLRSIASGRGLGHEELLFVRPHATRCVGRVPLADFVHSFRVYQEVLWRAAFELAAAEEAGDAALLVVGAILEQLNVAARHAGEVYLDAERLLRAQGDQVRRDLLEDLLAGRPPLPGPKLAAAREAGLQPSGRCLLLVAIPAAGATSQESVMRSAGGALVRAMGLAVRPLMAVRGEEVVIVAPAGGRDPSGLATALSTVQGSLAEQGVRLAVGVSTIQDQVDGVPEAYREALAALEPIRAGGGVVALPALRAFDYLTRFSHETVRRLVPAPIRRFVDEDLAEGGVLTSTLLEYVAVDLNVKAAAERLHLHANTAHYRLARIEERTGCNVRRLADVLDLLIAVQAAQAAPVTVAA